MSFAINEFRNRDLQAVFFPDLTSGVKEDSHMDAASALHRISAASARLCHDLKLWQLLDWSVP